MNGVIIKLKKPQHLGRNLFKINSGCSNCKLLKYVVHETTDKDALLILIIIPAVV